MVLNQWIDNCKVSVHKNNEPLFKNMANVQIQKHFSELWESAQE